jgi:hypothetical protein
MASSQPEGAAAATCCLSSTSSPRSAVRAAQSRAQSCCSHANGKCNCSCPGQCFDEYLSGASGIGTEQGPGRANGSRRHASCEARELKVVPLATAVQRRARGCPRAARFHHRHRALRAMRPRGRCPYPCGACRRPGPLSGMRGTAARRGRPGRTR